MTINYWKSRLYGIFDAIQVEMSCLHFYIYDVICTKAQLVYVIKSLIFLYYCIKSLSMKLTFYTEFFFNIKKIICYI